MCRKPTYLITLLLVLSSVGSAATIPWTGRGGDRLWSNPANWQSNMVPTSADEAYIDAPAAEVPNGPVIQVGIDAKAALLACDVPGKPAMTMTGGTLQLAGWGMWWGDGPGCHATFDMSGGIIDFTGSPGVFEMAWQDTGDPHGSCQATWNMTGGTVNAKGVDMPGKGNGGYARINLYGGVFNVGTARGGLVMYKYGLIDVTEGALVLEGDQRAKLDGLIATGQITAYDGAGYFELDFDERNPGKTTLTAVSISGGAYRPNPPDGATDVARTPILSWSPGINAVSHSVYFGDKFKDVNEGTALVGNQPHASYGPLSLQLGKTYYWRIDEVNADGTISPGAVWSFTVAAYVLVDDFEDYNDVSNRIWFTWEDGFGWQEPPPGNHGNGTGAIVDVNTAAATVHGGSQSLRIDYDNDGTFYNIYAELKHPYHSEVQRDWTTPQDWTRYGVKALSLWFRGYPAYLGSFAEAPTGTYTITAGGADIWGTSDQFHFAFKEVSGASTVVAKVLSVSNTDPWAKAGVMIRDSLDPTSTHAMVVVTPGNGVAMQYRATAGAASTTAAQQTGIVAPQWVKIERTIGGLIRGYYSPDGTTWTQLGDVVATVVMDTPMYVGLALTSHNVNAKCVAQFSNVSFPGTTVGPQWNHQDIGTISNVAEPMYVAISSGNGKTGVFYHEDPNATLTSTWTEWPIDLKDFSNQGVNLTDVTKMFIGFGNKADPKTGGNGKMYFDDIRLYVPRCIPDKVAALAGDLTNDCTVDVADLQIMANDWLQGDHTRLGQLLTYWAFDEGSGTIARDTSGKGHDGVISGATWRSPGYGGTGYCLSFNGLGNEVNDVDAADYLNGLDAVTFAVWIKSNLTNTDRGFLICANPDSTDNRGMRYDEAGSMSGRDDVIKCGITSTEGIHEIESSGTAQTTDWQHVAMAWKSGEPLRLYINGVLDGSFTNQPVRGGVLTGYTKLLVGRGGKDTAADSGWNGLVDEVRIYDYALSQDQIKTVMNKGSLPSVELYYPLLSVAELYSSEPVNSKKVNFKDYAILAEQWLKQQLWP
jgi:hypothetical protein